MSDDKEGEGELVHVFVREGEKVKICPLTIFQITHFVHAPFLPSDISFSIYLSFYLRLFLHLCL